METEKYKEALNGLKGKSGAFITEWLSGSCGENGMVNNLMKMVDDLEVEKKVATQVAKKQGIGIGASVTSLFFVGAATCYFIVSYKKQKTEEKRKEEARQKQLAAYREELKKKSD